MNNFEAAIVKYVCPICGSVVEDKIGRASCRERV